jgi:hypothetical protein
LAKPYLTAVRWAEPGEGPEIKGLCLAGGMSLIANIDWSKVEFGWLLGEDTLGVVACVQIQPGWPFAHFDMLFVHPSVTPKQKALIVRDLTEAACAIAREWGSQVGCFTIPDEKQGWKKVVERRRCVPLFGGTSYMRKL